MTQITRLFPHQAELDAAPDLLPKTGRIIPAAVPGTRAPGLRAIVTPAAFPAPVPPAPPAGGATAGELQSPLRLARLINTLETASGIPDHIRAMPGMTVLREHLAMQSALNGLLRGLIKE